MSSKRKSYGSRYNGKNDSSDVLKRNGILKAGRNRIIESKNSLSANQIKKAQENKRQKEIETSNEQMATLSKYMYKIDSHNGANVMREQEGALKKMSEGMMHGHRFDWNYCKYMPNCEAFSGIQGYKPAGGKLIYRFILPNINLKNIHNMYLSYLEPRVMNREGVNIKELCKKITKLSSRKLQWLGEKSGVENVPASKHTAGQELKAIVFWINQTCYKLYLIVVVGDIKGKSEKLIVLVDFFYCDVHEKRTTMLLSMSDDQQEVEELPKNDVIEELMVDDMKERLEKHKKHEKSKVQYESEREEEDEIQPMEVDNDKKKEEERPDRSNTHIVAPRPVTTNMFNMYIPLVQPE